MAKQVASLNEEFLAEFECPICTRYMLPPIRQCQNGHCVCCDCFGKIPMCAICRAPKSEIRPITLEKIQACLMFPCVNEDEGCQFQALSAEILLHQQHCKFSQVPCPLRFNDCQWKGEKSRLIVHCRAEHTGNIFFTTRQKLLSSNFRSLTDRIYYIMFYVFNNIFRCTWDLNKQTGLMRFAVYCLEKPLKRDKFAFEVSYMHQDSDAEIITVKAPCYFMEDDSERFLKGKYFILHHELIKDFCDGDGNLNYSVNIFEKK